MTTPFTSVHVKLDAHGYRHIIWTLDAKYLYPLSSILRLEYNRAGASPHVVQSSSGTTDILGLWLVLCLDASDLCEYVDYRNKNHNKVVNDYYRLVLISGLLGTLYKSAPVKAGTFLSSADSALVNNLLRLALKLIDLTGRPGVLLKRKLWGLRCYYCTDFDNLNSVNLHCPVCLGTGITGGYYKGIPMGILLQNSQQALVIGPYGYLQALLISAKCVAWPWIHLLDVWVDSVTNQRYYIKKASVLSKYKHVPLVYAIELHLLLLTDVLHTTLANKLLSQLLATLFVTLNTDWHLEDF